VRQQDSRRRLTINAKLSFLAAAGLLALGNAAATESTQAIVIGIHTPESTRAFATARGVPEGQAKGGRYAVVRLVDGRSRGSVFALVYVPPNVNVRQDDKVEIAPCKFDLVTEPGMGVVLGVTGQLAASR
jgi:hypothetical protein